MAVTRSHTAAGGALTWIESVWVCRGPGRSLTGAVSHAVGRPAASSRSLRSAGMLRPVTLHLRRAELDEALAAMAARASEHDREATFPHEAFDALLPTGALSLTVPAALGGGGGGLADCCELVE